VRLLELLRDVAWGMLLTLLVAAWVVAASVFKSTPPKQGEPVRQALRRVWDRYRALVSAIVAHPAFWGFLGLGTAFWIAASVLGWLP
jgi:ABC-type phosphate/phosphonate transport system permease subunit